MSELSPFIDDGCTRDGRVEGVPGIFVDVRFSYRPATSADIAEQVIRTRDLDDVAWHKLMSEKLAKHIVSWNIRNKNNEVIPITPENCGRLINPVFMKLYMIINGSEASADLGN
jgi:hypothetical protein